MRGAINREQNDEFEQQVAVLKKSKWHGEEPSGSIVMVWLVTNQTGCVGIETLGTPPKELAELDGLWITRRSLEKAL